MFRTITLVLCGLLLIAAAPAKRAEDTTARQDVLERRVDELAERYSATTAHEQRDLAAQESMAASAKAMITLTLWQIALGVFGAIGLGATVYYGRKTFLAAKSDRDATRDAAVPQLAFHSFINAGPALRYTFINAGVTATKNQTWNCRIDVVEGWPAETERRPFRDEFERLGPIAAGQTHFFDVLLRNIAAIDQQRVRQGEAAYAVTIEIRYEDIFGRSHEYVYRELRRGGNLEIHKGDTG